EIAAAEIRKEKKSCSIVWRGHFLLTWTARVKQVQNASTLSSTTSLTSIYNSTSISR
ncbi:Hypothetical predicted protein, partial [Podarcis lilfordi]